MLSMAARLFCDSPPLPRDGLNYARKVLGHSGPFVLSDCYCCWLMAPSQPCLLSAGLSSKMDIAMCFPWFFGGSEFNPPVLVRRCVLVSFYRPYLLLCRWNLVLSGSSVHTQISCKETRMKILYCWPFAAGSYSFPPAVCAAPETQHSLSVSAVFPVRRPRVECCDPLRARDPDGIWTSCFLGL